MQRQNVGPPQVEITADHQLEGGTCTDGGHKQFFINNSSNNTVWQFSYGGFNGEVHLLIEFVVVELFKWKGKMSAPQIRCRSPPVGEKMRLGGHQQFIINNSSDNVVWQFSYGGFNGEAHLLIEFVVAELFKCKSKMSAPLRWRSLQITSWRGETCTCGGHCQFLVNSSSDNIVWQFSYGGFNGSVHLLIEFVVAELLKFKGKMSSPQMEIIADDQLEGGKCN